MFTENGMRSMSYVILGTSLVAALVVFGIRATYIPGMYIAIAGILIILISLSAWNVGGWVIRADTGDRRRLAVAGGLMIAPVALFSLLPGIGPPGGQTPAENQFRYTILLINAMVVSGGLIMLREVLRETGERFYSTLGFAAVLLGTPLYLIWAILMLVGYRTTGIANDGETKVLVQWMSDFSDVLLFFGGILTYLATAAFARSLRTIHWLGPRSAGAFVIASLIALLVLVARGFQFPDPAVVFAHWYSIPGFIVGIPAIPWVMPCMLGVAMLRRAGNEPG